MNPADIMIQVVFAFALGIGCGYFWQDKKGGGNETPYMRRMFSGNKVVGEINSSFPFHMESGVGITSMSLGEWQRERDSAWGRHEEWRIV